MRRILFFLLWSMFFSKIGIAQLHGRDKIYITAIEKYLSNMDSLRIKYPAAYREPKEIYLEKPYFVDSIPSNINGYKIFAINNESKKHLYQTHNNKLIHTVLFPLTNDGSKLFISIIPYRGELKKSNHYNLGVSDGVTVYFKFDARNQQYSVEKIDLWGI